MRDSEYLLNLNCISKKYSSVKALDEIDLNIAHGEVLALLGENGAGKTTTISIALGFIRPDSGSAKILGENPLNLSIAARSRIGFMFQDQERSLPSSLSVKEIITQTCGYYRHHESLERCAEIAGMSDVLSKRYKELSGGQKRSMQFAMAICGHPELIFLDEPTVGIDVRTRQRIWKHLRELKKRGTSILLTTHYLEEAEALADRVVVLDSGRIIYSGGISSIIGAESPTIITCYTTIAIECLKSHRDVVSVEQMEAGVMIVTKNSDALLRWLFQHDENLANIALRKGSLADLFLGLTQNEREGRDGGES
ncbi:hypothetical protein B1757_10390 [Acidithiobacillus marinus]|uniref:ABC transporter domain-containing protein n=1 Tax=Acidithiobacillus marinus TaxID=187490 RepID=A0A2I1DKE4_9PROT|nr:ABC transporter ATP-binding protein [Acidithiobacillus marinus]PKY10326.1 hypothetical protein B1757_10390 [Acidithiobacillus marinus]